MSDFLKISQDGQILEIVIDLRQMIEHIIAALVNKLIDLVQDDDDDPLFVIQLFPENIVNPLG